MRGVKRLGPSFDLQTFARTHGYDDDTVAREAELLWNRYRQRKANDGIIT